MNKETEPPLNPQKSLQALHEGGPLLAQAKADRVFLEAYAKSLKAILMKESNKPSVAAQEVEAYSHEKYLQHLEAIKIAVEREDTLRWRMVTAQAAIEVWRSMESSARTMARAAA